MVEAKQVTRCMFCETRGQGKTGLRAGANVKKIAEAQADDSSKHAHASPTSPHLEGFVTMRCGGFFWAPEASVRGVRTLSPKQI